MVERSCVRILCDASLWRFENEGEQASGEVKKKRREKKRRKIAKCKMQIGFKSTPTTGVSNEAECVKVPGSTSHRHTLLSFDADIRKRPLRDQLRIGAKRR